MQSIPEHAFTTDRPTTLRRARSPVAFLPEVVGVAPDRDGAALVDIAIADGRVASVAPAGSGPALPGDVDLGGRHLWPTLVDVHAHLDKGHIVERTPNPDGTHFGALTATAEDRTRFWRRDDLIRRMEFGLACAEAHGVSAIRTHLDSQEEQGPETWAAFGEVSVAWKNRVALQAVALAPMDIFRGPYAEQLADIVAETGGLMGGVTRATGSRIEDGLADLDALLDRLFALASDRDLDVDLHVDETNYAAGATLPDIARATIRNGYEGRVTCGHCCSLALQDEATLAEHVRLVRDAGISIVTLPTVNMYLQDRQAGRTPRWRGVTPVTELRAAGVRVAVAGDNCRDPFYAYGDHDMLDTFRQGVKILHLDHPYGDAAALAGPAPAAIMGLSDHGAIRPGAPASFIVMNAWSMDQVLARPQSDRIVVRNGRRLAGGLPSYATLVAAEPGRPTEHAAA
ncbi:cytosine deaminase [Chelatococcus sambhunathii]|uniref:Cytosine deaminase n=1 Tax=Chelatococcus sambhunathii TaxID=363953 RepID=A0ABU1DD34_9HYPH|nr:cytosine deaminase [Chelatococcus sambhunathii]MDR4306007.1 cytosine deaminase [Chelatococcus sambhunathii]